MFNRSQPGYLEKLNIEENLHRFEEDAYATTYLVGCFNPEFKIRVSAPREAPFLSKMARMVGRTSLLLKMAREVF